MQIIHGLSRLTTFYPRPVLAIGVFDGLHRGHQRLIRRLIKRARQQDGTAMVMTFAPHPVQVLHPDRPFSMIVSLPHRLELLESLGVDVCLVARFTPAFSQLPPERFVKKILAGKIRPVHVIVGDDFRFGKDRSAGFCEFSRLAENAGFSVSALNVTSGGHKSTSSTIVRRLLSDGDIAGAARLLGRPVSLMGKVVRGHGRGRSIGYPTANIRPGKDLIPLPGVYIVGVRVSGRFFQGMANIGTCPTFQKSSSAPGRTPRIEVHLFDHQSDLYGRDVVVCFFKRLRDEQTFVSSDGLVVQLKRDEARARRWFLKHPLKASVLS